MKYIFLVVCTMVLGSIMHTVHATSYLPPIVGVIPRVMFHEYERLDNPVVERCERFGYQTRYILTGERDGVSVTFNERGEIESEEQLAFVREHWSCDVIADEDRTLPGTRDVSVPEVVLQKYSDVSAAALSKSVGVCTGDELLFTVAVSFGVSAVTTYFDSNGIEIATNVWDDVGAGEKEFDTSGFLCDTLIFKSSAKEFDFASSEPHVPVEDYVRPDSSWKAYFLNYWYQFTTLLGL